MARSRALTAFDKAVIVCQVATGRYSHTEAARRFDVSVFSIRRWTKQLAHLDVDLPALRSANDDPEDHQLAVDTTSNLNSDNIRAETAIKTRTPAANTLIVITTFVIDQSAGRPPRA
jgi:transposase-like protein